MSGDDIMEGRVADLSLRMRAEADSVMIARQAFSGLADAALWDHLFVADVKLALSEACTNVVVHAYPEDGAGRLDVAFWVNGTRLELVVTDEGRGITPNVKRGAGLGLGLPLMAALSDTMTMRTTSAGETQVCLAFALPGPPTDGA